MRATVRRALAVLLLGSLPSVAGAGEPRMFLTWHAPYGLPGAAERLSRTAGDTTTVDTLYLSFDPGRSTPTYIGMTASLDFRGVNPRAPGDSLSPAWDPAVGSVPPRLLRVEFPLDSPPDRPFPWPGNGTSAVGYRRSTRSANLHMVYAVPPNGAVPVDSGRVYTFARILLRRPAPSAWRLQPVCIEWAAGSFAYNSREEPTFNRGGQRFASLNSPDDEICEAWKGPAPPVPKPGGR